jgi:DNA repair photolyase
MIISASRRTDIPKYYSEWFINRIREGFVDVRNPIYASQVSRYGLSPDIVDGIVFWTKDPMPMLNRLDELSDYSYYFQFSLTPYGKDAESNLPDKQELLNTFKELSSRIGSGRVNWRYDPILLNSKYTMEYQIRAFEKIATELSGYTQKVTISFIDEYNFGGRSVYASVQTEEIITTQQNALAEKISEIAHANDMAVDTCSEKIDLAKYGIEHARCVDGRIFEKLNGCKLSRLKTRYEELAKDTAQRKECLCVSSIDIGCTNTCLNGCKYCYATSSETELARNRRNYNPNGSMLCGEIDELNDNITDHRGSGDNRDRSFSFGRSEQLTFNVGV